jgi:hypothetical protein
MPGKNVNLDVVETRAITGDPNAKAPPPSGKTYDENEQFAPSAKQGGPSPSFKPKVGGMKTPAEIEAMRGSLPVTKSASTIAAETLRKK